MKWHIRLAVTITALAALYGIVTPTHGRGAEPPSTLLHDGPGSIRAVSCHACYVALAAHGNDVYAATDSDDQAAIDLATALVPDDGQPTNVKVVYLP